ncbi:MAG: hypothetical protein AAF611_10135 [Bacteroidota bacterium]
MEISRHCSFCEYKKFDLNVGNLCGLTDQKADFVRKCPKIKIDFNAKEKIAKINLEYKSLTDKKASVIWHLILYLIIGVAIIFAGIYFVTEMSDPFWNFDMVFIELEWFAAGTLAIFSSGMFVIGHAFKPFIKFTNAFSVVKSQKREMENLLALYDYDYNVIFEEEEEYEYAEIKLYKSKRPII